MYYDTFRLNSDAGEREEEEEEEEEEGLESEVDEEGGPEHVCQCVCDSHGPWRRQRATTTMISSTVTPGFSEPEARAASAG